MQITLDPEDLKKKKLMICTPMYNGQCGMLFALSCLKLQTTLLKYGIKHQFNFLSGESLIPRARNRLTDMFEASNCTHLLFKDADICFQDTIDIVNMLALDYDILCGPYPKKAIDWEHVIKAKNKDEAMAFAGQFVLNLLNGTKEIRLDEPVEVLEAGTGFMMIARRVFDRMKQELPHVTDDGMTLESYTPIEGEKALNGKKIVAYFDTCIDKSTGTYLSEDYAFCRRWRAIGGKIFLCPWMRSIHTGMMDFIGDIPKISQTSTL